MDTGSYPLVLIGSYTIYYRLPILNKQTHNRAVLVDRFKFIVLCCYKFNIGINPLIIKFKSSVSSKSIGLICYFFNFKTNFDHF